MARLIQIRDRIAYASGDLEGRYLVDDKAPGSLSRYRNEVLYFRPGGEYRHIVTITGDQGNLEDGSTIERTAAGKWVPTAISGGGAVSLSQTPSTFAGDTVNAPSANAVTDYIKTLPSRDLFKPSAGNIPTRTNGTPTVKGDAFVAIDVGNIGATKVEKGDILTANVIPPTDLSHFEHTSGKQASGAAYFSAATSVERLALGATEAGSIAKQRDTGVFYVSDGTQFDPITYTDDDALKATTAEARAGVDDTKYMTPLATEEAIKDFKIADVTEKGLRAQLTGTAEQVQTEDGNYRFVPRTFPEVADNASRPATANPGDRVKTLDTGTIWIWRTSWEVESVPVEADVVSQIEAEAGSEVATRTYSPERVSQAIDARHGRWLGEFADDAARKASVADADLRNWDRWGIEFDGVYVWDGTAEHKEEDSKNLKDWTASEAGIKRNAKRVHTDYAGRRRTFICLEDHDASSESLFADLAMTPPRWSLYAGDAGEFALTVPGHTLGTDANNATRTDVNSWGAIPCYHDSQFPNNFVRPANAAAIDTIHTFYVVAIEGDHMLCASYGILHGAHGLTHQVGPSRNPFYFLDAQSQNGQITAVEPAISMQAAAPIGANVLRLTETRFESERSTELSNSHTQDFRPRVYWTDAFPGFNGTREIPLDDLAWGFGKQMELHNVTGADAVFTAPGIWEFAGPERYSDRANSFTLRAGEGVRIVKTRSGVATLMRLGSGRGPSLFDGVYGTEVLLNAATGHIPGDTARIGRDFYVRDSAGFKKIGYVGLEGPMVWGGVWNMDGMVTADAANPFPSQTDDGNPVTAGTMFVAFGTEQTIDGVIFATFDLLLASTNNPSTSSRGNGLQWIYNKFNPLKLATEAEVLDEGAGVDGKAVSPAFLNTRLVTRERFVTMSIEQFVDITLPPSQMTANPPPNGAIIGVNSGGVAHADWQATVGASGNVENGQILLYIAGGLPESPGVNWYPRTKPSVDANGTATNLEVFNEETKTKWLFSIVTGQWVEVGSSGDEWVRTTDGMTLDDGPASIIWQQNHGVNLPDYTGSKIRTIKIRPAVAWSEMVYTIAEAAGWTWLDETVPLLGVNDFAQIGLQVDPVAKELKFYA